MANTDKPNPDLEASIHLERDMANPPFVAVAVNIVIVISCFLAVSWATEHYLGWTWPQVIMACIAAMFLVPGCPAPWLDMTSWQERLKLNVPLWSGRTVLLIVLFLTYDTFVDFDPPRKWIFAAIMTLLIVPIMWYAIWQMRQFGMMAMLGVIPVSCLPVVFVVPPSQVLLWGITVGVWFSEYSIMAASIWTGVSLAWQVVGNIILVVTLAHGQRLALRGSHGLL